MTVQGPVPVHAPVQRMKVLFAAGVAVSVTDGVPAGNVRAQNELQLVAVGENDTVPLPERGNSTSMVMGGERNVAVMFWLPAMVNVQLGGPLQPTDGPLPPQPLHE